MRRKVTMYLYFKALYLCICVLVVMYLCCVFVYLCIFAWIILVISIGNAISLFNMFFLIYDKCIHVLVI